MKGQIGVVIQGKSSGDVKSADIKVKLRYTPENLTYERSNWGSFSRPMQCWVQISCAAVNISWHKGKNHINWDTHLWV